MGYPWISLPANINPTIVLILIDNKGAIIDRYDKMFCSGDIAGKTGDFAHYSPGNHFSVFTIHGFRGGPLICHDYRYPELYRQYKLKSIKVMFHSYHAGHLSHERI
ncbi:MAG: hypothetical protein JXJ04_15480 [Spirochaetales bacterium]|nr:hypothetical protein [Spirochaetales bacterium]